MCANSVIAVHRKVGVTKLTAVASVTYVSIRMYVRLREFMRGSVEIILRLHRVVHGYGRGIVRDGEHAVSALEQPGSDWG